MVEIVEHPVRAAVGAARAAVDEQRDEELWSRPGLRAQVLQQARRFFNNLKKKSIIIKDLENSLKSKC